MKDFIFFAGIVLLPITLCAVVLVASFSSIHDTRDEECKQRFGEEWGFRAPTHSPSMCVNQLTGEGKYY